MECPSGYFWKTWVIDVHAVTAFASSHVFLWGTGRRGAGNGKGFSFLVLSSSGIIHLIHTS